VPGVPLGRPPAPDATYHLRWPRRQFPD
jgi:hypothetical protein